MHIVSAAQGAGVQEGQAGASACHSRPPCRSPLLSLQLLCAAPPRLLVEQNGQRPRPVAAHNLRSGGSRERAGGRCGCGAPNDQSKNQPRCIQCRCLALTSSLAESPIMTSSLGTTLHLSAMCSSAAGLGL